MNTLATLIKCTSIAFLAGLMMSTGFDLGATIWPLTGLLVLLGGVVVLFQLTGWVQDSAVPEARTG